MRANNIPTSWLWLIPLLLFTTWLAARGLNAHMIWYDEYRSLYYSGIKNYGPIGPEEIIQRIVNQDSGQMPLYFWVLSAWSALVGTHQFAIRALSLFAGLLAVAWTYRLGRDMGTRLVGLIAAVVMGGSAFFILYLHELRPYSLMVAATGMNLALYWRAAYLQKPLARWLLLSLVILLYTQPFAVPVVLALGLFHLLFARRNKVWRRVLWVLIASGVFILPWGLITLGVIAEKAGEGGRSTALANGEILTQLAYAFSNGTFVLMLIFLVSIRQWRSYAALRMLWFLLITVLGLILVANQFVPIVAHIRYTMTIWPVLAVIAGFAVIRLTQRGTLLILLLAVWLAAGVFNSIDISFADRLFGPVPSRWFRPHLPFHLLSSDLLPQVALGDAIAIVTKESGWGIRGSISYYLHGTPAPYVIVSDLSALVDHDVFIQRLRELVAGSGRVWLVTETVEPEVPEMGDLLNVLVEKDFHDCGRVGQWPGLSLDLYAPLDILCETQPGEEALLRFDEGIRLVNLDFLARPTADELKLVSTWSVPASVPPFTYSVAFHISDADGNLVAQTDFGLPEGTFGYVYSDIQLSNTPPGDYDLSVIVYQWETGLRLKATNTQTGEQNERLLIDTFTVPAS